MNISEHSLKHSPLAGWHRARQARLTPFAGWEMPLQYATTGILAEHRHTRKAASLFDVSHMCQMRLAGEDRDANIARLLPLAPDRLKADRNKYCCLSNEQGGIIDDLVAGKDEREWFVISNAARAAEVQQHLRQHLQGDCELHPCTGRALLAVQGPQAAKLLEAIFPEAAALYFMDSVWSAYQGHTCRVCRCGYTGEDGFEISLPAEGAEQLAEQLCASGECQPAGLGARDSLRLEAGLSLYGQDLTTECSLVEAGLEFCMSPSRRTSGGFIGAEVILPQLREGPERRLVGLKVEGKRALRAASVLSCEGKQVGVVTSGNHSPTLGHPIALAMVDARYAEPGTGLAASLSGRDTAATVARLPFVTHNYRQRPRKKAPKDRS